MRLRASLTATSSLDVSHARNTFDRIVWAKTTLSTHSSSASNDLAADMMNALPKYVASRSARLRTLIQNNRD
jgi:hypothetical protein